MEWRAGLERSTLKFRVVLAPNVVRVLRTRQLGNLHPCSRGVPSDEFQPSVVNLIDAIRIDLISMPVTLADSVGTAVKNLRRRHRSILVLVREFGVPCTEAHGTAHIVLVNLGHEDDNGMVAFFVKLGRIGIFPVQYIAGILHHHGLETEANSEVWLARGTAIIGGQHFALESTISEATRHNDAIGGSNGLPGSIVISLVRLFLTVFIGTFKISTLHPNKVELASTCNRSVLRYERGGNVMMSAMRCMHTLGTNRPIEKE